MHLHRSNDMEALVKALGQVVAEPVGSPFDPEIIAVESRGTERWLSMALAHRMGIWANPAFPYFGHLIETVFQSVLGDEKPLQGPFTPPVMQWSIAALLDDLLGHEAFAPLRWYLQADPRGLKKAQLSARIAETFYSYLIFRQDLIALWETSDPATGGLPEALAGEWQPILWRALVARHGQVHLWARVQTFKEALEGLDAPPEGLPRRLCVMGISAMPPLYLEILRAIDPFTEVHLFVVSPSKEYWADLHSERSRAVRAAAGIIDLEPGEGPLTETDTHLFTDGPPLLAALGRLARDFQYTLEAIVPDYLEDDRDLYLDPLDQAGPEPDMLATLQSDVLHLRRRRPRPEGEEGATPLVLRPDDRSISMHACHGPMREVEVLKDQLLDLFEHRPDLEPRDVLVMLPEVESYGPFIEAVFGEISAPGGADRLPFRLTDLSLRATNKVIDALMRALEVLQGRMAASDVLDLLAMEPVRGRFGIEAESLDAVRRLVAEAGIRWGVDAAHRSALGQPHFEENTWRFGLNRLLLGYAMPSRGQGMLSGGLFGGVLPHDAIEGGTADLLGRLVDFCETLFDLRTRLVGRRSPEAWSKVLAEILDRLMTSTARSDWQARVVRGLVLDMGEAAAEAGHEGEVELEVVQSRLSSIFAEGRAVFGFLSGGITFCALGPLRCLPFKVVALLGMNDEAWPRIKRTVNFDRIAQQGRIGDRTLRDSDRYAFLQAVLSARQHLIITWTGASVQDNSERPPSPVVTDLLDTLSESFVINPEHAQPRDALAEDEARAEMRRRLVSQHPLKPYNPRYFEGETGPSALFSYSTPDLEGARRLVGERHSPPPFVPGPLILEGDPDPAATLDAADPSSAPVAELTTRTLVRFFQHPVRGLLRGRLGLSLENREGALEDREPMELNRLMRYQLGTSLLHAALDGQDVGALTGALTASGALPLGTVGRLTFERLIPEVLSVARAAAPLLEATPEPALPVDLVVSGTRLTGRVEDLRPIGRVHARFGRLSARHQLGWWVDHLILGCLMQRLGRPGLPSVLIGTEKRSVTTLTFKPVEQPIEALTGLLRLYHIGQTRPLRLFPRAAMSFAETVTRQIAKGTDKAAAMETGLGGARRILYDRFRGGEADDPWYALAFGHVDPLRPGEKLYPGETDPAFGDLALEVFGPLLEHRVEGAP